MKHPDQKYLIGQLVVVHGSFIGRVTKEWNEGIWVRPLIEGDLTHSCYAPHNVAPYSGH